MPRETAKIYNRILLLREDKGWSRKDLADKLAINFQTIGYLERGEYNPSLDLAFKISDLFGLPIDLIFSKEPFKSLSEELLTKK